MAHQVNKSKSERIAPAAAEDPDGNDSSDDMPVAERVKRGIKVKREPVPGGDKYEQ